jgi:hypothetical protein
MKRHWSWLALGLLLALVGCSDRPTLVDVKGKVMLNGKPLKNVRVAFHPDPDKGTRGIGSTGTTDADGAFTLTYDGGEPGAIAGHHRVILDDLDVYGNVFVGRGNYRNEDGKGTKAEVPKKPRFDTQFTGLTTSPIRQEVKVGMPPITIEVK